MFKTRRFLLTSAIFFGFCSISLGQPPDAALESSNSAENSASISPPANSLADVLALLEKQQEELLAQRGLIEAQVLEVAQLRSELDALRAPPVVEIAEEVHVDGAVAHAAEKQPLVTPSEDMPTDEAPVDKLEQSSQSAAEPISPNNGWIHTQ